MKKRKIFIVMTIVCLLLLSSLSFANRERNIKVWINDFYIMSDVHPFIESDRTFVPIRFIAEELGYTVGWDGENQEVIIIKDETLIKLTIDSKKVSVNDKEILLELPAQLKQSRTFIPLRAITEITGEDIDYNAETHVATIGENFGPDEFYPLKYYSEDDIFITNSKINFVDYIVRYSNGKKVELNSDSEILNLIDEDAEVYEPIDFISEVEEEKQLEDKYYIAPIEEDAFVGTWYRQGLTHKGSTEYYDSYMYIEKIGNNNYKVIRRQLKNNGSDFIIETKGYYDETSNYFVREDHKSIIKATGDYGYNWTWDGGEMHLKEFDYMEDPEDPKTYLKKY